MSINLHQGNKRTIYPNNYSYDQVHIISSRLYGQILPLFILSLSVFIFTSFWILLLFIAFDFKVGELSLGNKSILDMERMLHCFSNVLHPSHYILIDIMHNLVHLYAGKKILSRPEKERKIQLCFNVLDVLGNNEFTSKLSNLFIQN